jgi:hypothetical protein
MTTTSNRCGDESLEQKRQILQSIVRQARATAAGVACAVIIAACASAPTVRPGLAGLAWPTVLDGRTQMTAYEVSSGALPPDKLALCLSGGGYRAMLFHAGVLWRLNELKMLQQVGRISAVSGGSITAATVGLEWKALQADNFSDRSFVREVIVPLRALASRTIDLPAVIIGTVTFQKPAILLSRSLDDHLFHGRSLRDFPDAKHGPLIVLNATDLKTGRTWSFSREVAGESEVGYVGFPQLKVADAVAASAAYPPVLAPFPLHVDSRSLHGGGWTPKHESGREAEVEQMVDFGFSRSLAEKVASVEREPDKYPQITQILKKIPPEDREFTAEIRHDVGNTIFLADGGVSDNAAYPSCTVSTRFMVSLATVPSKLVVPVGTGWVSVGLRSVDVIETRADDDMMRNYLDRAGRALRLNSGEQECSVGLNGHKSCGAVARLDSFLIAPQSIKIGSCTADDLEPISGPEASYPLPIDGKALQTRLSHLSDGEQEDLINWGYLMADSAVRTYLDKAIPPVRRLPYSKAMVKCN